MAVLIASGDRNNLADLGRYEDKFAEGDRGILVLNMSIDTNEGQARQVEALMRMQGVKLTRPVEYRGKQLLIYFQKAAPWLAIIAGVLIVLGIILLLMISWQLLKVMGLNPAVVMPFLLLGGVILIGYYLMSARPSLKIGGT